MLVCGDCFLAGAEEDEKLHLRVVATPPAADGCFVSVSVTTRRKNSENLVILQPGDHPFLRHESVVAYRFSEIAWVETVEAAIESGEARKREPLAANVLRRLQEGLIESEFTPNGVRNFAKEILNR